ncbi:MAG: ABC transporter substrate-binding protein [Thermoleophilia bacterium]|nr:ABC transporter substrate-binding protein [Thermoleophilia bacterium]
MKLRVRRWRLGAIASLVTAAAVAVGAGAVQSALGSSSQTAILVAGTTDSITNIDPAGNYDYGSFALGINIVEHLYDAKNSAKIVPSLATGCKPVGTTKTWSCTLRRGVKFHDGSDFDSADVKFSFDRVLNKQVIKEAAANTPSSLLSNLKSVRTNGKYAVTFNLKTPQSTWPFILTTGAAGIVPQGVYPPNKLQPNNQPQIGTGPYRLTRYTPGQQAVFEPFDDYWGPKPKNDGLIIRYYSKSSTMKLALERGEIDMAFQTFTPTELASLQKAKNIRVHQGPGAVIRYLVLNVERPPFDNVAVRRAVAYMIPRQAIASRVYRGTVKPLYSMPPAGLPGHIDAFATRYGRAPNPTKAKAELRAAGLQTPFPIEIWWTPTHYGDASADEYAEMKRGLEKGGVFKVTLKSSEWAQYSSVLGNQYNAFQLGWFPDYADPENYVLSFYQAGNFTENGYESARMTKLLNQELAATTTAKRVAIIRQIQQLAAVDVPIIPYWQSNMIAVGRSNVRGIPTTLDPAFIMRYWKISKS